MHAAVAVHKHGVAACKRLASCITLCILASCLGGVQFRLVLQECQFGRRSTLQPKQMRSYVSACAWNHLAGAGEIADADRGAGEGQQRRADVPRPLPLLLHQQHLKRVAWSAAGVCQVLHEAQRALQPALVHTTSTGSRS